MVTEDGFHSTDYETTFNTEGESTDGTTYTYEESSHFYHDVK